MTMCLTHRCIYALSRFQRNNRTFYSKFIPVNDLARDVSRGDTRLVGGGRVVGIRIYRQVALLDRYRYAISILIKEHRPLGPFELFSLLY